MNQPEKPNKRIVSKAEYILRMSEKGSLHIIGGGLLIFGILLGGISLALFVIMLGWLTSSGNSDYSNLANCVYMMLFGGLIVAAVVYACILNGREMISAANEIAPVVPFTQANADHIPASDSLVRASSEPEQEQESVLLRASMDTQQTPADQLLRPVGE